MMLRMLSACLPVKLIFHIGRKWVMNYSLRIWFVCLLFLQTNSPIVGPDTSPPPQHLEIPSEAMPSELSRPYLCTNFDLYVTREPCTMYRLFTTFSIILLPKLTIQSMAESLGCFLQQVFCCAIVCNFRFNLCQCFRHLVFRHSNLPNCLCTGVRWQWSTREYEGWYTEFRIPALALWEVDTKCTVSPAWIIITVCFKSL